jgi:hypothetical protein
MNKEAFILGYLEKLAELPDISFNQSAIPKLNPIIPSFIER